MDQRISSLHVIHAKHYTMIFILYFLQWKWVFVSFTNESFCNGICREPPLQLAQFINVHFLPICKFSCPNRTLLKCTISVIWCCFIHKLQLSNGNYCIGSYSNWICRALLVYLIRVVRTTLPWDIWPKKNRFLPIFWRSILKYLKFSTTRMKKIIRIF